MKDMYIFLLDYGRRQALERALLSLQPILTRINHVTILGETQVPPNVRILPFYNKIDHQKIQHDDLGATLNHHAHKVTSKYVLFLYNEDYLSTTVKSSILKLHPAHAVMTHPYSMHHITIQRPFLVRTASLVQKKLPTAPQIPFQGAILPLWLRHFHPSDITTSSSNIVKQLRKSIHANHIQKQTFLKKFDLELKPLKQKTPTLAVMMANYNMAPYVETALNSCLWQQDQPEQVLIVDDGSTDESKNKLEKWTSHPKITMVQQENKGKAKALNALLPRIHTDFVIELDADDWLDPDAMMMIRQNLANLQDSVAVLYGNLRTWKQRWGDVQFKRVNKGSPIHNQKDLLSYHFPLGPRIYRTSVLTGIGGFPVTPFQNGRLYEDVSVLHTLIANWECQYQDFTVYNVRDHDASITKRNHSQWNDFLKHLH